MAMLPFLSAPRILNDVDDRRNKGIADKRLRTCLRFHGRTDIWRAMRLSRTDVPEWHANDNEAKRGPHEGTGSEALLSAQGGLDRGLPSSESLWRTSTIRIEFGAPGRMRHH